MDSGASHVLLPLHMLKGSDLDAAKKIQVNLAVGHREGRMFRDALSTHQFSVCIQGCLRVHLRHSMSPPTVVTPPHLGYRLGMSGSGYPKRKS
eukprot:3347104-Amphidinium_carterae.1